MYNPREDLYGEYEEDYEDYELSENESLWSPGLSSRSTSLSLTPLTPPPLFEDDEIYFPSYDDYESHSTPEDDAGIPSAEPESSPELPSSAVRIPHGLQIERPEDDTAVRVQPSRHVDYLSHDWKEEELWASWKHIVSRRKIYSNSARLENASWRAWEKKRRNLKTTSPETVRWLKDHDVTWLYGPLQPGFCTWDRSHPSDAEPRRNSAPPDSPHFPMKPILKKRSLSELMLRRSTSFAPIPKPTVLNDDSSSSLFSTPGLTRANTSPCSSSTNLNRSLNSWKIVRFHELVEQCIALTHPPEDPFTTLTSQRTFRSSSLPSPTPTSTSPSGSSSPSNKTIQKLPHAPLKSPEPEAPRLSISRGIQTPAITSPPGQLFLFGDEEEEEEEEEEEDDDWRPPSWMQGRRDSVHLFRDRLEAIKRDLGTSSTLPSPPSISIPPAPTIPTPTPFQLPPSSPTPPCLSDTTSSSSSSNDEDDDDDYDYIETYHHQHHSPSSSSSSFTKPLADVTNTPIPLIRDNTTNNIVSIVDSVRDTCTAEMERGFRDWEAGFRRHWDRDWELELGEEEAWTMAV